MTIETAMIFAAGFGTRMGGLTATQPKPMLHLAGRPMIDHSIELLRAAGIRNIFANTHYLPDELETHLNALGVKTLREYPILETGGGLRAALPWIGPQPVITMNPDAAWDGPNPVEELLSCWKSEMTALLLLTESADTDGDFDLKDGTIRRVGPYKYTGLQVVSTNRLDEVEETVFSLNLYWDLLMKAGPLHGLPYSGSWTDIGTRDALEAVNLRMAE